MTTATFTPIVVTVETLQILAKQPNYADLLALYMAYVEITTWQQTVSIRATKEFMLDRLHWGEVRWRKAKAALRDLGLIEDVRRTDDDGKVEGWYLLVRHVVLQNPPGGIDQGLDSRGTSTNNYQLSTTNSQTSAKDQSPDGDAHGGSRDRGQATRETGKTGEDPNQEDRPGGHVPNPCSPRLPHLLAEVIGIVNPRERSTPDRLRDLSARLKDYTPDEILAAARAFAKSPWHREHKQLSVDNLLRASKFGRWYAAIDPRDATVTDEDAEARLQRQLRQMEGERW